MGDDFDYKLRSADIIYLQFHYTHPLSTCILLTFQNPFLSIHLQITI